jgi:hypothetical protein
MYAVIQRVNALCGAVSSLNAQVRLLNEQVAELKNDSMNTPALPPSPPPVTVAAIDYTAARSEELGDVKRLVQKVQLDVIDKHSEVKKETKMLETTLMLKVEQLVNKMVKDRHEALGHELRAYVDSAVSYPEPAFDSNEEEYEINVTLAGEKDTPLPADSAPKRKSRAKKTATA